MTALTGTGTLIRLTLRRDRIILPLWIVLMGLFPITIANSTTGLYPTAASQRMFADQAMSNPAELGSRGIVYAANVGGLTAWTVGMSGALISGLISLVLVIRHSRVEEETGRRELVGAAVVGRHAPLTAALATVLAANLLIGVVAALGLIALGLPAAGSVVLGLSLTSGGWILAGVAAVTAQLTTSATPARGLAVVAIGVFFALRAAGDLGTVGGGGQAWLSWVSPYGWLRLTRAYAGDRWWVFLLVLGLMIVLVSGAFALSSRRDVASGFFPARDGRATAREGFNGPFALAWRLHRGLLIAGTVGFAALGGLLGLTLRGLNEQLDTPAFQQLAAAVGGGRDTAVSDVFFHFIMYVMSQAIAAYAIVITLRLRAEESAGRVDPLLTGPTSRWHWMSGHLFFAAVGPVAALAGLGLGAGLSASASSGDIGQLGHILGGTLGFLPAVWTIVGLAIALFGLLPRAAAAISWIVLGLCLLVDLLGEFRMINETVLYLSPFFHAPRLLLGAALEPAPLVALTAIAVLLALFGVVSFRRRDVS